MVYLTPIQLSDITEQYLGWLKIPEVVKYTEIPNAEKPTIERLKQMVQTIQATDAIRMYCIRDDDGHIGNIKIGPVNKYHRTGDIGLIIGEKSKWGLGYATEAIKQLVVIAFDEMKLEKVTASCYVNNVGSFAAFTKADFIVEGIRHKQCIYDGKRVDVIMMGRING